MEALVRQLDVAVPQRPVLMIFEDVHWIDPSSREFADTSLVAYRLDAMFAGLSLQSIYRSRTCRTDGT